MHSSLHKHTPLGYLQVILKNSSCILLLLLFSLQRNLPRVCPYRTVHPISVVSAKAPAPPASPGLWSSFADPIVLLGTVSNGFCKFPKLSLCIYKTSPTCFIYHSQITPKTCRNSTDTKYCFFIYHQKGKLLERDGRWIISWAPWATQGSLPHWRTQEPLCSPLWLRWALKVRQKGAIGSCGSILESPKLQHVF